MNAERVENMFDGVREVFISEMRKLKNRLVDEFDASEKLKDLNQKCELKRLALDEENQNYKVKEKQLKNDLAILKSQVEDKEKLIKVLDPTGVGQRLIRSFNVEEIEKLNKRIAELKSKEKGLLETNTKLEAEKAENMKTIDELRREVLDKNDRQVNEKDLISTSNEKIVNLESKIKKQLETIDKLESWNWHLMKTNGLLV